LPLGNVEPVFQLTRSDEIPLGLILQGELSAVQHDHRIRCRHIDCCRYTPLYGHRLRPIGQRDVCQRDVHDNGRVFLYPGSVLPIPVVASIVEKKGVVRVSFEQLLRILRGNRTRSLAAASATGAAVASERFSIEELLAHAYTIALPESGPDSAD